MIYICNAARCRGEQCTLEADPIDLDPEYCPFNGDQKAEWSKSEENTINHEDPNHE